MSLIKANLQGVNSAIARVERGLSTERANAHPVCLIAVSKTQPAERVQEAFAAGHRVFGENYVQEAVSKITALRDLRAQGLVWHLIGPLQSNKAKLAAEHFDWVQTVDREKIALALSTARRAVQQTAGLPPLKVCIQVNISGEATKSGASASQAAALVEVARSLPGLEVRGLMAIIENSDDEALQRSQFRAMFALFKEVKLSIKDPLFDTLSMGMSQDFSRAIEEGSTMVRIGSAIFGARA